MIKDLIFLVIIVSVVPSTNIAVVVPCSSHHLQPTSRSVKIVRSLIDQTGTRSPNSSIPTKIYRRFGPEKGRHQSYQEQGDQRQPLKSTRQELTTAAMSSSTMDGQKIGNESGVKEKLYDICEFFFFFGGGARKCLWVSMRLSVGWSSSALFLFVGLGATGKIPSTRLALFSLRARSARFQTQGTHERGCVAGLARGCCCLFCSRDTHDDGGGGGGGDIAI